MNLAEMLCYADIDQLTRIAQDYECHGGSHSKNELIQSILAAIHQRESLENRMNRMSGDELRFLNTLLFENRSAYSMEELKAQAAGATASMLTAGLAGISSVTETPPAPSPGQGQRAKKPGKAKGTRSRSKPAASLDLVESRDDPVRQTIIRFKHYGWLFNGFSHQTRYLYQVPDDVKRSLKEALDRKFRPRLDIREEPPVYRDEGGLLMDDLKTFVRYVRDHDVQLAADGVIYKRQLLQLLSLMSVYEEAPDKTGGWRFGYGRKFPDYPDRFSFMYDYACRKKLIQELPDRLLLMEEGRDFADGSHSVDLTDLYRFWLRLYKTPIPNITAVSQWVARLCTEWTTVVSLFDILKPLIRPYHFDKESDILRKRILNLMMHLGLLRSGVSANGEDMVRTTEQGKTMVSSMTVSSGGQPI